MWLMGSNWKVIAEWFSFCWVQEDENNSPDFLLENKFIFFITNDNRKWIASRDFQSWISTYTSLINSIWWWETLWKQWWLKNDWKILVDWYDKCYPFDKEIRWFAKFEKIQEDSWYTITWYIDIKWREWENVKNRGWNIYVQTGWKWYIKKLVK
jgi:hypothetical protein